ncbi:hybrid signal transduction histidine kinase A-like isoform X2 [Chelonus insularis]|uniref:hybrid signal transduction histidine kinase A-like isoform X2 n=1 Tax=Chelonus insularis TaxID=460826 RepID=UPI001588EB0A|nr:hybrid signal transduction histidine kinase A-like isoform X2 [Chelonus insularis]
MIDSTRIQGSSGLATALKDRSTCPIPVQPNRSLPVRPAPHIPCRAITSKKITNDQPTSNTVNIPTPSILSNLQGTKRKPDNGYNKKSHEHHFIDISNSPERHGVDDLYSTTYENNNKKISNELEKNGEIIGKKRRKKGKKPDDEEINSLKIPPLRLKKIQSLQENQTSYLESIDEDENSTKITENKRPLSVSTFRYYQPEDQDNRNSEGIRPISKEHASKYRIVTGQTPPYDERIDSSTASNKNVKEMRCHQNKLKLKLRELKKKTVELSRVMLKTALTSPCTPVKETIDSYSEQIEKLTNMLKMIPESVAQSNTDCEINKDIVKISSQVLPTSSDDSSSFSTNNERNISSFNNLPSPEPPKLSPKITGDYENTNPSQIRNSPPHLPIATSNNDNDSENDWENCELFKKLFKQGEDISKPYSNIGSTDSLITSPIITTTTGSVISEEINIEDKPEFLDLTLLEMPKTEVSVDTIQNNDDEGNVGELNMQCEVSEVLKIDLRRSPSPEEMIIDTTSTFHSLNKSNDDCDDNSSVKSLHIDVDYNEENDTNTNDIRDKRKLPDTTSTIQSIMTSSCNVSSEHTKNPSIGNRVNGEIDPNIAISNEFPTLGSWLAKISTKLRNQLSKNAVYDANNSKQQIIVNNNNNEVPVYDQNQNFNQELPKKVINSATLNTNSIIESQMKNKQWHEQQQQQQLQQQSQIVQRAQHDSLTKSTPSISPSIHKKVPEVEQPIYPQILMDRYYPRNYSMDPYRPPLIHSQNIQNGQLPDMQNGPKQYHMNSSVASMVNPMSVTQNPGLPYWHSTVPKPLQEPKRAYSNIPLGYDPMALSKRVAYPPIHPMMSPMATNFVNQQFQQMHQQRQQQQIHPSQQQQVQYDRIWPKPTMCLQPSDAQMQPMNYPPPWRGPLLLGPENLAASRSYGLNNNWTSDPCNLLSTLAPTALQNLAAPYQMGPRVRNVKERMEQNRSCETPHLAKVTYSPNTAKTYACSNCGLRGPLFKCLGCEIAYYCDESCQARHWNRHVVVCPKKMPKLKKVVP